jgi:membrane protease YdiL (CAAX protease family)
MALVASALLFLIISSFATDGLGASWRSLSQLSVGFCFNLILGGLALFPLLRLTQQTPTKIFLIRNGVLLVCALVEEIVFRSFLPKAISRRLANVVVASPFMVTSSWLIAQIAFALCHTLSRGQFTISAEFLRLIAAGLLYGIVVCRVGVGLAAAVHAALNSFVWTSLSSFRVGPVESIAAICFALIVLQSANTSHSEPSVSLSALPPHFR